MKKHLTDQQEFDILKLVLDKFLWLGFGIMAFGLYVIITGRVELIQGLSYMVTGAIVLIIFMVILLKEYEISR